MAELSQESGVDGKGPVRGLCLELTVVKFFVLSVVGRPAAAPSEAKCCQKYGYYPMHRSKLKPFGFIDFKSQWI